MPYGRQVCCVIGAGKAAAVAAEVGVRHLQIAELQCPDEQNTVQLRSVMDTSGHMALDDVALILQTSGTTAVPKLVPFTLRRLCDSGGALATSMNLSRADMGLGCMPLHHVGGIACNLFAPLVSGGSVA